MEANLSQLSSLEQEAVDEGTKGDRLRELAKISIELARADNTYTSKSSLKQLVQDEDHFICLAAAKNLVRLLERCEF